MKRSNVFWIMADQFHADCLGVCGRPVRTPNLDALAAAGVMFTRAYCNNPICAPSRVSFLTGQYLHTHGIQGNRVAQYPVRNPDTLPALFRRSGYRTAQIGKAHVPRNWLEEGYEHLRLVDLADAWPYDPTTCHYFKWLEDHGIAGWYEDGTARPGCDGGLTGTAPADLPYRYSNEAYTGNETLAYLEGAKNDERPFFVKMSFERPHAPMRPARESFDLYDPESLELPASAVDYFERRFAGKPPWMIEKLRHGCDYPLANPDPRVLKKVLAAYYALITCIDMEIGRAIDWLKKNNQYENTVFIFTADHGDFAGEHGLFHKNFGIYECLHRIPFIFKMPGGPSGERRRQMIESVDVFPTLCDIANLALPAGVEGASFLPAVNDPGAPGKKEVLAEYDWFEPGQRINALRTERHRLVYYDHEHGGELYDHADDPGEIDNLWDSPAHQGLRLELLQRLFDRVNGYRTPLSIQGDRQSEAEYVYMPSRLVQFGKMDWETLKRTYATPAPGRGPRH